MMRATKSYIIHYVYSRDMLMCERANLRYSLKGTNRVRVTVHCQLIESNRMRWFYDRSVVVLSIRENKNKMYKKNT